MTLHIYELTFISEGGEDDGGIKGERTLKPVTIVGDCVLTFVGETSLDILQDETKYFIKTWHADCFCLCDA